MWSIKMAAEDVAVQSFLLQFRVAAPVVTIITLWILARYFYGVLYAKVMKSLADLMAKSNLMNSVKRDLFSCMSRGTTIVEIGAGSGANFEFYPPGCTVTCVEPKLAFESYVTESVKEKGKHLASVTFVEGFSESLSSIFEENSADYVVCTLVMCSVKDVERTATEIKRILKPGGVFVFLEHVWAPEDHRLLRLYQSMITVPWRLVADNCHFNREPWKQIETAGFHRLVYQRRTKRSDYFFSPMKWYCSGSATK